MRLGIRSRLVNKKILLNLLPLVIMMKIFRTKQIEDNKGKTLISEGIDANYLDMLNYAVFALIKFDQESN